MFIYNDQSPITFNDPLPASVDVVVIGGGIIGVSTAWFLRQRGMSVLICDKGRVAGEQSSRNWGWVRSTGRDADEVPIAMESTNIWEQLSRELGDGIGFRRGGIGAWASSEKELNQLAQWLNVARTYGLDTQMLSNEKANEMAGVPAGTWKGALYTPSDGRAEPFTAVKTLAEALQARGGLIRESCAARSIEQQAGAVCGVHTEHGYVKAQAVVCAAGVWSTLLLSNLGISLPQLAVKGTVARTVPVPKFYDGAAGLEDIYIRRRQDGGYTIACGMVEHTVGANSFRYLLKYIPAMFTGSDIQVRFGSDPTQQPFLKRSWNGNETTTFEKHRVLNPEPSAKALRIMRKKLAQHVPQLASVPFAETWAGVIDAMPDIVPVMDSVATAPGLFLASGFSAHGFGIGPGAGKVMAGLVAGDKPEHNLTRFRFSRFSDGSPMSPGPAL